MSSRAAFLSISSMASSMRLQRPFSLLRTPSLLHRLHSLFRFFLTRFYGLSFFSPFLIQTGLQFFARRRSGQFRGPAWRPWNGATQRGSVSLRRKRPNRNPINRRPDLCHRGSRAENQDDRQDNMKEEREKSSLQ